jgi:hypothetical protein
VKAEFLGRSVLPDHYTALVTVVHCNVSLQWLLWYNKIYTCIHVIMRSPCRILSRCIPTGKLSCCRTAWIQSCSVAVLYSTHIAVHQSTAEPRVHPSPEYSLAQITAQYKVQPSPEYSPAQSTAQSSLSPAELYFLP